ncbi:MAG TPA: peroxiredoxin-like family protein [Terriglobales bacterium]|nr:peroxiredoxin-like family protein [Terriglobales bacterium]
MDWRGAAKGGQAIAGIEVPLRQRLSEIRRNVEALLPVEKLAPVERAIAQLAASGQAEQILKVGAVAPEFALPDQAGNLVRSADLLARGPMVAVFYRGRWCPYCVTTLETWNQWLPQLEERGATLVAISPQKPQHTFFTADQHKLAFKVLSDSGNAVARKFGLAYRLPDYLEQHYRRVFINLPNSNGENSWELPLAATFVIGQDGRIRFAHAQADFRLRAEPADVLAGLRSE